jgi:GNAT superfamily N-acetyltransferase
LTFELRPVRPADRERVLEISAGVWDGNDYLPEVFDEWTADPGASFQAAEELDGTVIAVHRLRPIARRLMFYEGLRVAADRRRQGIGRAMVQQAVEEARGLGFEELRCYTGNPDAGRMFLAEGFRLLTECATWTALRVEGGDPPRLGSPAEAGQLAERLSQDPALAAYGGVNPDWNGVLDVDAGLLERQAEQGLVRVGAGGRAVALIRAGGRRRLVVTFLGGSGAAAQDLLTALRFEADAVGFDSVAVLVPSDHPALSDLTDVGYHLADDEGRDSAYAVQL